MSDDEVVLDLDAGPPPTVEEKQQQKASVEQYALCAALQRMYPPTDDDETEKSWFDRAVKQLYADHKNTPVQMVSLYSDRKSATIVSKAKALAACCNAKKRNRDYACVQGDSGTRVTAPVEVIEEVIARAKPLEIACVTRYENGDFIASTFSTQVEIPAIATKKESAAESRQRGEQAAVEAAKSALTGKKKRRRKKKKAAEPPTE